MTVPSDDETRLARAAEAISERFVDLSANLTELRKGISEETAARNSKVDAIQQQSHAIRRQSVLNLILIALVVILTGSLLFTQVQNNSAAQKRSEAATEQRTQQQNDTEKVLAAIQGCTSPGGECFRANRDDTAAALDLLQQFQYAVGYCAASNPDDPNAYRACVLSYKVPGAPTSLPGGK